MVSRAFKQLLQFKTWDTGPNFHICKSAKVHSTNLRMWQAQPPRKLRRRRHNVGQGQGEGQHHPAGGSSEGEDMGENMMFVSQTGDGEETGSFDTHTNTHTRACMHTLIQNTISFIFSPIKSLMTTPGCRSTCGLPCMLGVRAISPVEPNWTKFRCLFHL